LRGKRWKRGSVSIAAKRLSCGMSPPRSRAMVRS
jgi:hypothetical protein